MSSPTHPTPSDVDEECAFPSANILDYTSTLPNYFPATPGNISSDFLENSKNDEIPPESPIPPQALIAPLTILPPSPVLSLSPMFDFPTFLSSQEDFTT
ncbi:hypothetical protein Tco_0117743 [Tanacetum coccineum]